MWIPCGRLYLVPLVRRENQVSYYLRTFPTTLKNDLQDLLYLGFLDFASDAWKKQNLVSLWWWCDGEFGMVESAKKKHQQKQILVYGWDCAVFFHSNECNPDIHIRIIWFMTQWSDHWVNQHPCGRYPLFFQSFLGPEHWFRVDSEGQSRSSL